MAAPDADNADHEKTRGSRFRHRSASKADGEDGSTFMFRKFLTILAVSAFALTAIVPDASAQRRGHGRGHHDYGGYYGADRYGCRDDNNYGCERDRDRRRYGGSDDGDAVAAGVIGLVLGAVIVSALTSDNNNNNRRDDGYYDRRSDDGYYRDSGGYDDGRYYDPPPPPQQCFRQERQWDRYANRYVIVDVPC